MSCSRQLAQPAYRLLLLRQQQTRTTAIIPEMQAALMHGRSFGSTPATDNALYSVQQPRLWPACVVHHFSAAGQQQQRDTHNRNVQPAPLLGGQRRSWRHPGGGFMQPPAAAASFTASTPAHGPPAEDDGPEGELHAVETAIRANILIFAAKLAVFFMSNSR